MKLISTSDNYELVFLTYKEENGKEIFGVEEVTNTRSLELGKTESEKDINKKKTAILEYAAASNTKMKNKGIFLFLLLFVIIGNSSIHYYFTDCSGDDFGVLNGLIKIIYHIIG